MDLLTSLQGGNISTGRNIPEDQSRTIQIQLQLQQFNALLQAQPNWLGHRGGAAAIDTLLLNGATLEALEFHRGAIQEHLRHLRVEHGLTISEDGGIFRFTQPAL